MGMEMGLTTGMRVGMRMGIGMKARMTMGVRMNTRTGHDPALLSPWSPQKLEFLQLFGLTTQQQKEELLSQKRRKRRRMLRERSPSPPTVQNKRRTPSPRLPLSTRYSPDEMNNSPNFEEKKRFLTIFNLTHISAEKRKGNSHGPRTWVWGCPGGSSWGPELALLSRGYTKPQLPMLQTRRSWWRCCRP